MRRFEVWTATAAPGIAVTEDARSPTPPQALFSRQSSELLAGDPKRAEQVARRALDIHPFDPVAKFLLGASLRRQKRHEEARDVLAELCRAQPQIGSAWREFGLTLQTLGERTRAIDAFVTAIDAGPTDAIAWRELGTLLFESDERDAADDDPRLIEARRLYQEERYGDAEAALGPLLNSTADLRVLIMLGDILLATRRWNDAETVFAHCVSLAPDSAAAQFRLASTLLMANKSGAVAEIEKLLDAEPGNALYRQMLAIALGDSNQFERAVALYDQLIAEFLERAGLWYQRPRLVRFVRPDDAVGLLEEMLRRFPERADLYYHIASMKSFHFDASWPARILAALERADLAAETRAQLHYALGKAYEDLKDYAKSFEHYRASNDILAGYWHPDGREQTNFKTNSKAVFTPGFFRARADGGCQDSGAIFIVGLPRSGSTLVDQILSSHSMIQSLGELGDLQTIVERELERDERGNRGAYLRNVASLSPERLRSLGEAYMARARQRLGAPPKQFFIDKAPSNFLNTGLIQLILPNAKIIDVRRHPLACCFSCYKHYFPSGQPLTMDLHTLGQAYADYVELMAHFDHVLPGRVHRIIYENLVDDAEAEIRRLLEYVGVPFEQQCLRFHETKRVVRTISAEQVSQPIYKSGVAQWKNYEPWLAPLKDALGCLPAIYPDVPEFFPRLSAQIRPYSLGMVNAFDLVKGLRQLPFETNSLP
ncbi:MAG TPA: sulfotransferase [Rhizomicrobium sp.]|jgi:tetratricopeptide (TPR) repeat protein